MRVLQDAAVIERYDLATVIVGGFSYLSPKECVNDKGRSSNTLAFTNPTIAGAGTVTVLQ